MNLVMNAHSCDCRSAALSMYIRRISFTGMWSQRIS